MLQSCPVLTSIISIVLLSTDCGTTGCKAESKPSETKAMCECLSFASNILFRKSQKNDVCCNKERRGARAPWRYVAPSMERGLKVIPFKSVRAVLNMMYKAKMAIRTINGMSF